MRLNKLIGLVVVISGMSASAYAERSPYTRCPTYIVNKSSGTYRRISTLQAPGSRIACTNNLGSLRRQGFIPEDNGPGNPTITEPELDTERVVRVVGNSTVKRLFRVASTPRVVTIEVGENNCGFAIGKILNSAGDTVETLVPNTGSSDSATILTPGIYGFGTDSYGGECLSTITVK